MALAPAVKADLVAQYQRFSGDTGSPEVQIALFSAEIAALTQQHFAQHRHDEHSKRGLLAKVSQQRRLLRYLKRTNKNSYQQLIKRLGLRDRA